MTALQMIFGAGQLDRVIAEPIDLLKRYRVKTGAYYLDYESLIPRDRIVPEDLAVTLLLNSQVGWQAFRSTQQYGSSIDLGLLPDKPLEQTSDNERQRIAEMITAIAQWPGFAASVATKLLHKKRPDLIPILDNQAIFGAYINPNWPQQRAVSNSIKSRELILQALNWIAFDINRPENTDVWPVLLATEPIRTRIQLFDSVWWMYFRTVQPVR